MRIRLVGPDDVLPKGLAVVYVPGIPRIGDMVVVDDAFPGVRFRVTDVCWYATGSSRWNDDLPRPDVAVEVER